MVGPAETIRSQIVPATRRREAAPPLHRQLLAQQPALPLLPLLLSYGEPGVVHPQSLLLP